MAYNGYQFFIGELELPYAPSEFKIKVASKNSTVELINGNDINILKNPKLQEISFSVELPRTQYPFAKKLTDPKVYIDYFHKLLLTKTPVRLLIIRLIPNLGIGGKYQETEFKKVSLESCDWSENAENGRDITVNLTFKEYIDYGTTKRVFQEQQTVTVETPAKKNNEEVKSDTIEIKFEYWTVKKGDTLWGISKRFFGTGAKWKYLYNANKTIIESTAKKYGKKSSSNGHWIYPGTKLLIPDID